jgi:hypothetical protein
MWWSSAGGADALSKCKSGSNKNCTIFDTNQARCPPKCRNWPQWVIDRNYYGYCDYHSENSISVAIAFDCSYAWWSFTEYALSKCQSGSNKKCTIFDTNQTKCPAPTANPQQACNISLSYQFPWANLLALNQLTVINGYYIVQSGKWCSKAYYKSADNNYIFFDSGSGKWYVAPTLGPSNVIPVFAFVVGELGMGTITVGPMIAV